VNDSAGLTTFTSTDNAANIMIRADIACYQAKNSGGGLATSFG